MDDVVMFDLHGRGSKIGSQITEFVEHLLVRHLPSIHNN